jgi:transposase
MLSPDIQARILALHFGQGKRVRAIARELGINRKSVAAIVARRSIRTTPADALAPRRSMLDPYKPMIQEKLLRDPAMPAVAIHQSLRKLGFAGSVRRLQEYVATVRVDPKPREAFLKLTFEPGETAQVDWGEFGDVFGDGCKIHAFVMVLCYSRKLYVEFTRAEKFEDFIRAHERAFVYFGGVTQECWYDNLASAVTERMGKLVRFNSRFRAYVGHHSVTPYACTPASGNEKGRVEDGVKYIRSSFWSDRQFRDFPDLQAQCAEWLNGTANSREHRSTRRIPALVFKHEEYQHMLGMNPHPYGTDAVISKDVPPQFHLTYETNQYSVPWTLVGMVVTLRADDESIRIYYGGKLVSSHSRYYGKHKTFTLPAHQAGLLERKGGGDHHTWQLTLVKEAGESLAQYLKLISSGHRSLRSEVRRLVALITIYGAEAANQAASELLKRGIVGAESLEMLLKAQGVEEKQPKPLSFKSPSLNRMTGVPDLSSYDAYCFESDSSPATAAAAELTVAHASPAAAPSETTETQGETHDNQSGEPDQGSH